MNRILIPETVAAETVEFLEQRGYTVERGCGTDEEALDRALDGCKAVMVRVAVISRRLMQRHPELEVIAKHGAGYDNIDVEAARSLGKRVVYAPQANSDSVAEHAMTLILGCAKRLGAMTKGYAAGDYSVKNRGSGMDVFGKTLGLVGFGRIGGSVARMARLGFGMQVVAFDPYLPAERRPEGIRFTDTLDEVLSAGDFISLHVPLTPENRGLISTEALLKMKNTAYLINTSRDGIVDTQALTEALKDGRIAGAGLDVTDPEPCPPDHPLFTFDNVILTPHSAAATADALVRMGLDAAKGIDAILNGREPQFPIV
jgi:D-3-phosphoglycerate dehydrogenase